MTRIALLGGDKRQEFLAIELRQRGFDVVGCGNGITPAATGIAGALEGAKVVLLPVPATRDGSVISASGQEFPHILCSDLLNRLMPGTLLLGGLLPPDWMADLEERGIFCVDYYKEEPVQLQNALLTAEGAIRLAMQELPVPLFGTQTAIVGYGRIGSLLCEKLIALGASVGVLARSPSALSRARLHGARADDFGQEIPAFWGKCRVLFNTVPERVLNSRFLSCLPQNCILIELASKPGGFDPDLAKDTGLKVIPAPGIPGRFYPEAAGKILADTVCAILSANGFVD